MPPVGISYEGLAWVTGAAVMAGGAMPGGVSLALAALYSLGAHGIMTLNDFKSVRGRPPDGHRLAAGAAGRGRRGARWPAG